MNKQLREMVCALRALDTEGVGTSTLSLPYGHTGLAKIGLPMGDPTCRALTRQLLVSLIEHAQADAAALYPLPE
jgi:hypothetical protein